VSTARNRPRLRPAALLVLSVGLTVLFPSRPAAALIGSAPSAPVLLTPPSGYVFSQLEPQLFSINAVDADGDPYTGVVTVKNAVGTIVRAFATHPSPTGVKSSGTPTPPLTEGFYTWSAQAVDATGNVSGTSGSASFWVEGPTSVGGGALGGTIAYGGAGLSHGSCAGVGWSLVASSAGAVFNLALVGYAGPVTVTASGWSGCDSTLAGTGGVNVGIGGTVPVVGSTISCSLGGTYTRVEVTVVLVVNGSCNVNNFPAQGVTVVLVLATVPTNVGGGVTAPVTSALAAGEFTVAPT
jgi:hypothetical protein